MGDSRIERRAFNRLLTVFHCQCASGPVRGARARRAPGAAAPVRTYHAGQSWWEPPGALHRVSRNASSNDPAVLLAIYIVPEGARPEDLMKPI